MFYLPVMHTDLSVNGALDLVWLYWVSKVVYGFTGQQDALCRSHCDHETEIRN